MAKRFVVKMAPPANLPTHRLPIIMPKALKDKLEEAAADAGLSMNEWVVRTLSEVLHWAPDEQLETDEDILRALGVDPTRTTPAAEPMTDAAIAAIHVAESSAESKPSFEDGVDVGRVLNLPKGGRLS